MIIPEYLFIQSPRDLRRATALADLEQMAQRVSQVPGVASVRGITRPTGESLEQAKLSWQAGEVGKKLDEGARRIVDNTGDLDRLAGGANELAGKLGDVRTQVNQAVSAAGGLVDALGYLQNVFGGNRALGELEGARKLISSMRELGDAIGANADFVANNSDWAGPVLGALNNSPMCSAEPACVNARNELSGWSQPATMERSARYPSWLDSCGQRKPCRRWQQRYPGYGGHFRPSSALWVRWGWAVRAACGRRSTCCNRVPTVLPTAAANWPTVYSNWSTRSKGWVSG